MKKILAFTLALAMVLSTWTSTFAASKEVEALANLKLLLNTTDAEVKADLTRAVGLAMVLKALGYTQEDANAKMAENTFVDLDKAAWAKGFAKLGEDLKITNGTSVEPKLFSPNWKLNERAFVAFLLRALGHDVDAAWAKAGELAKENGLTETVSENKLTKGEAAVIMYNALKAKVVGDEKGRTLAEKLVADKKLDKELAVANGLISAEPEKLTVSAMADNLIEVTVSFDGTVDKDTAEKTGNYKVKGKVVDKATVLEDGKTVVLRLATALSNKAEQQLTVSGVKNAAGTAMDKQVVKFMTNDVTAPTVEKVTITGPKSFEVTYSEPIEEKGKASLLLGKSVLSATAKEIKSRDRVVVFEVLSTFREGKEYTIRLGNGKDNKDYAKDFAKYAAPYFEETFTYAKDTTVPEVKVVKSSQTEVTLEFTKPVTGITKNHFFHTFKSYTPVQLKDEKGNVLSDSAAKEARTQVTLVFYNGNKNDNANHPFSAGEVTLTVLGKEGNNKIKDNWGNELANTDLTFGVTADREAPQVSSVEVTAEDEVKVVFSEEIIEKVLRNRDNYVFTDKDNKKVNVASVNTEDGNKVAKVKLSSKQAGKTLTLVVKNMKDASLYENVMADYSTTLDFSDKTLKNVEKVYYQVTKDKNQNPVSFKLFVIYGEDMDESVLDLDNFKLKKDTALGKADYKALKGEVEFLEGKTNSVVVTLPYKAGEENELVKFIDGNMDGTPEDNLGLVVSQKVKDLAGNTYGQFETVFEIKEYTNNTTLDDKKIVAVSTKKIELEFNNDLVSINEAGFKFKEGATDLKFEEFNQISAKKFEFIMEKELRTDLTNVKVTYTPSDTDLDVFGVKPIKAEDKPVGDKVAPAIAAVQYEANASTAPSQVYETGKSGNESDKGKPVILVESADGMTATVKVKFTEDVKKSSLSTTTFKANNGWEITSFDMVGNANKVVTFTFTTKDKADFDGLKDLVLTQVSAFKDNSTNENASVVSTASMDTFFANNKAAALVGNVLVVKAQDNKSATITINVDKDINYASVKAGTFTLNAAVTKYQLEAPTASGTGKQIVLTVKAKDDNQVDASELGTGKLTLNQAQAIMDVDGYSIANILDSAQYTYQ